MTTTVYLVHGTWAHGLRFRGDPHPARPGAKPRWFEAGSIFRVHLESLLGPGVQFAPFLWSGANTIRARHEASLQLAAQLRVDRERDPQARRLVIAHSHGGNVALRAIDLLGEPVPLATLATPFLSIRRRALSRDELDALVVGRSVARSIFVILLLVVTMVVAVLAEEATGFRLWRLLVLALVLPPWIWKTWRQRRRLQRRLRRVQSISADTTRPLGEAVVQVLSNPTLGALRQERLRRFVFRSARPLARSEHNVVAIRLPRDEASLALGLARLFELAADGAWKVAAKVMSANTWLMAALHVRRPTLRERRWAVLPAFGVAGVLYVFDTLYGDTPAFSRERITGVAVSGLLLLPLLVVLIRAVLASGVAMLASVSVAPLLLSAAGVFLAPFGVELLRCGLVMDARAGSVPEGVRCRLVVFEPRAVSAPAWRMRHLVYEYAPVRSALARWIASGRWPDQSKGSGA